MLGQHDRLRPARDEHLLDPLRERDHRDPRQVVGLHRLERRRRAGPCRRRSRPGSASRRTTRRTPQSSRPAASRAKRRATTSAIAAKSSCPACSAHGELAVVGLLGDAVLEARPSSRRSPGPGCSRCRSTRSGSAATRGSALAQLLERLDPAQPLRLGDERLRRERKLGVLLRELLQPPLLAPLRRAHLDPRAAQLRQERLQRRASPTPRGTRICGGIDGAEP